MSNIKEEMAQQANYIIKTYSSHKDYNSKIDAAFLEKVSHYKIDISTDYPSQNKENKILAYEEDGEEYLTLTQAYDSGEQFLTIRRNISSQSNLISTMYYIVSIILIAGIVFILYYANFLSTRLMQPLRILTDKFSNMNESMLQHLDIKELPHEFRNLGVSVNLLITKIQTFINYRKELYVGTAHELKTPLAVMRLKNQITLMKHKKQDKIRETLQQNIDSIDTLNAMIHNILEYGRAEGAQFEKPERVNLIRFMATKCEGYELLAQSQNRSFIYHFSVPDFKINVQPLLFMQIFQNFIQNSLRFTPENGLVSLQTRMDRKYFIIEIIDEGPGIDSKKDLFAPFQRSLDSTGAGLGLFLAQNAAQSMGIVIDLQNRKNESGAIASMKFPLNRFFLKD